MAILSIQFSNVNNGQDVVLPITITASINAPPSAPPAMTLSAVSRQIDNQALSSLQGVAPAPLPCPCGFNVGETECPTVNSWYKLSVYAWDSSGDCTVQAVTFRRIASPSSPVGPGPTGPF